jgi:nucleoside-diphosphate-sugar epimerase
MKILITGSTSFIGRHLMPLLEAACHDVWHLVREKKGFKQEFVWDFAGPLPENLPPCKIVLHLAAYVSFSQKIESRQYMVNTVSIARLAKYCQETGASLILTSMIGIHGSTPHISRKSLLAPENHYAMSKLLAEEITQIFTPHSSILRIGGIYGLDGPTHLGLNIAISRAFHKKAPPILKGAGMAKRNYICVTDVVQWIFHLIRQGEREINSGCDIYYLAGPETMSIREYLQTIVDVFVPDKDLVCVDGEESGDCVIEASPLPFPLTKYRDYLEGLKT